MPGRWVDDVQLQECDILQLKSGIRVVITALQSRMARESVYNFTVEKHHCYAVGAQSVLVHNDPDCLKLLANASNKVPAIPAPSIVRTFTSTDPHVGELATKIEAAYPGHVVGVNIPIFDHSLAAGKQVTDLDILLKNSVIQVKSGRGKGLEDQVAATIEATGMPTFGFGPDLSKFVVTNTQKAGGLVTKDEALLLEIIKP
jgi:hypothetical protein